MAQKQPTTPDSPIPGAIQVPPGRSLADMPKGPVTPAPEHRVAKPNSKMTLKQFITENDKKSYLVPFLADVGNKLKKGPWREYLEFYRANLSGDLASMSPEIKIKVEKMKKDLEEKYFEAQDL